MEKVKKVESEKLMGKKKENLGENSRFFFRNIRENDRFYALKI